VGKLAEIRRVLADGGPGFCQIAITNACNAACGFCSFSGLPKEQWIRPSVPELTRVIDALIGRGVGYLVFVGGEPLMHPGLPELIKHATSHGAASLICTNGSLLTPERIETLHAAGLKGVIISIDAPSEAVHEKNRGFPGLCKKVREANAHLKRLGYNPTASVTVSRLVGDFGKLPAFLDGLGFGKVTFSYPLRHLSSSYLSFSEDSNLVEFDRDELVGAFRQIIELKKQMPVLNPRASLEEMIRSLNGERPRFP
jgi:MoaA/NifB/PqqE/SkfB family radical SAM enzyme